MTYFSMLRKLLAIHLAIPETRIEESSRLKEDLQMEDQDLKEFSACLEKVLEKKIDLDLRGLTFQELTQKLLL